MFPRIRSAEAYIRIVKKKSPPMAKSWNLRLACLSHRQGDPRNAPQGTPREPKGNSQGAQRAPLWPKGPPETTKGSPRDPTGSAMAHPRAHSLEAAKKAGFPALQGERPKEPKGSPKGAHREPKGPARPFGLPVKTTMKTSVKTSMKDQ